MVNVFRYVTSHILGESQAKLTEHCLFPGKVDSWSNSGLLMLTGALIGPPSQTSQA